MYLCEVSQRAEIIRFDRTRPGGGVVKRRCAVLQAEARAEFAERSVQKLQKEVDRLEGNVTSPRPTLAVMVNFAKLLNMSRSRNDFLRFKRSRLRSRNKDEPRRGARRPVVF
ncbi:Tropomyosin [Eumeta japonica]|uniref:Tropomyosin n=1 Tax=Eumeta variegata TaxID=151549 RepID=A0A4C1T056_EUMVA|nr:Tropomyosin [Eumeta japonica]